MTVTLARRQRALERKQRDAMRDHAGRIEWALGKQLDERWILEKGSVTTHSVILRGPREEALLFQYPSGLRQGQLTVIGLHPGFAADPDRNAHQALTLGGELKPRAIAAEVIARLLPDYVSKLNAWRVLSGWDPQEVQLNRRLAEDIAGMCGGDVRTMEHGFTVTFQQGSCKGDFGITHSGLITLSLASTDPDVFCELAARLPRLGNR